MSFIFQIQLFPFSSSPSESIGKFSLAFVFMPSDVLPITAAIRAKALAQGEDSSSATFWAVFFVKSTGPPQMLYFSSTPSFIWDNFAVLKIPMLPQREHKHHVVSKQSFCILETKLDFEWKKKKSFYVYVRLNSLHSCPLLPEWRQTECRKQISCASCICYQDR